MPHLVVDGTKWLRYSQRKLGCCFMEVVDFLFTNMGFGRRRPAVLILIKNFTKGKKKKKQLLVFGMKVTVETTI